MDRLELLQYSDTPCRIRLKSGKEVFGVILEKVINNSPSYFFASATTHRKIRQNNLSTEIENIATPVSIEEIIKLDPINSD